MELRMLTRLSNIDPNIPTLRKHSTHQRSLSGRHRAHKGRKIPHSPSNTFDSITLMEPNIKGLVLLDIRKDYRFTYCRCKCSQIIFGCFNLASNKPSQAVLTFSEERSKGLVPKPLRKWSCGGGCFEKKDIHVACNGCQFAVRYRVQGKDEGVWLVVNRVEVIL